MKKKFLSFILAICLILPCAFALSACGKNPPSSGPVDLAGQTIVIQPGSGELDWNSNIVICSNEVSAYGNYVTDMSLERFVEQFYESNPEFIKNLAGNSNINTIEEAKTAIRDRAVGTILSRNPIIKFSEDGSTATTYAGNDINLETPLKTYTVQKSGEEMITYDLYEEQEAKIRIICDSDSIEVSDMWFITGEVLTYNADFDLNGGSYSQAKITLTNDADVEKEFSLAQCTLNEKAHTLTLSLKINIITYKVK